MWRDIVGCASCTCSCSTHDHECPVTVKTYALSTVRMDKLILGEIYKSGQQVSLFRSCLGRVVPCNVQVQMYLNVYRTHVSGSF